MLQPKVACSVEQVKSLVACQEKPLVLRKTGGFLYLYMLFIVF